MARPKKDFKVKRNGDSLQVYWMGDYVGSISLERLCLLLREERAKSTGGESAHEYFIKGG